jgi:hypothetical protein
VADGKPADTLAMIESKFPLLGRAKTVAKGGGIHPQLASKDFLTRRTQKVTKIPEGEYLCTSVIL